MTKTRTDTLMNTLERQALAMLKQSGLNNQEKLKAMEVAAKVLQIKHKITDGDQIDGAFFQRK